MGKVPNEPNGVIILYRIRYKTDEALRWNSTLVKIKDENDPLVCLIPHLQPESKLHNTGKMLLKLLNNTL